MSLRNPPGGAVAVRVLLNRPADVPNLVSKARAGIDVPQVVAPPLIAARDIFLACPRAALPAGLVASQMTPAADGNWRASMANLTAGAIDPAVNNWDVLAFRRIWGAAAGTGAAVRVSPTGRIACRTFSESLDHGSIAALTVLEAPITVNARSFRDAPAPAIGDPVIVAPRVALPAGLALSHARYSAAGTLQIGLANMTAGAIDPVAIQWDVATFYQNRPIRTCHTGRPTVGLSAAFDPPSIASETVSEVSVSAPGARVGDVAHTTVFSTLNAGVFVSHARVSADDTVLVGIANPSAGAIDPASTVVEVLTIPQANSFN